MIPLGLCQQLALPFFLCRKYKNRWGGKEEERENERKLENVYA